MSPERSAIRKESILFIVNPASNGGKAEQVGDRVISYLSKTGTNLERIDTHGPGHALREAKEAVKEGVGRIIVCGGDGTVHEVANALAETDAVLGIIPAGRGNDLARAAGIPPDPIAAAETALSITARRFDLGKVAGRYFGTIATLGFDSEVSRAAQNISLPLTGRTLYIYAILRTLISYRASQIRLEGDFGVVEGKFFLVATGNSPEYGGGIRILPQAVSDDGTLDICVIRDLSRIRVLFLLRRAINGLHTDHPKVQMLRSKSLQIETDTPMWIYGDGEKLTETPARIENIPGALRIAVP